MATDGLLRLLLLLLLLLLQLLLLLLVLSFFLSLWHNPMGHHPNHDDCYLQWSLE